MITSNCNKVGMIGGFSTFKLILKVYDLENNQML
jgi:hypothetical protein